MFEKLFDCHIYRQNKQYGHNELLQTENTTFTRIWNNDLVYTKLLQLSVSLGLCNLIIL